MENTPKVGVGVIIRKGREILMGKRINAHGNETWSFVPVAIWSLKKDIILT